MKFWKKLLNNQFVFRKFWHSKGNYHREVILEISGCSLTPSILFVIDGGYPKITIGIRFIFAMYFSLVGYLPKSWYPKSYDNSSSRYGRRDTYLRFSDWTLYWNFWKDDTVWSNTDSKIRHWHLDFRELIIGKHECKIIDVSSENHTITLIEGDYDVEVVQKLRIDSWKRWPKRESSFYSVQSNCEIACPNGHLSLMNFGKKSKNHKESSILFQNKIQRKRDEYKMGWIPSNHIARFERSQKIDSILE